MTSRYDHRININLSNENDILYFLFSVLDTMY